MNNNTLIKDLIKLCNISYFNQKDINKIYKLDKNYTDLQIKCINVPKLINSSCDADCQVYTTIYNKEDIHILLIIFRGTSSNKDILIDLDVYRDYIYLDNYTGKDIPLVHSGFLQQFETVKDKIIYEIEEYKNLYKERQIICTGHSLGGALATLASLYFHYKYKLDNININTITFGSPRVGDKIFVKLFNKNIEKSYRFVNDNDPIPLLPTPIRYKHVKGCYWLYEDKILNEIKVNRCFRFIRNLFLNLFGYIYNPLDDHKCISYINDINIILDNKK